MVIVTEPVPLVSAAPPVGVLVASAAQRSQKTVPDPILVRPPKLMLLSKKP